MRLKSIGNILLYRAAKQLRVLRHQTLLQENGTLFSECFPYVCPEPVLAKKDRILSKNRPTTTVFAYRVAVQRAQIELRERGAVQRDVASARIVKSH